ncbi:MAG: hypothetical protein JWR42_1540, partial [Marmoricola sp.]|nr:hypothetical protein [Marmoricola sp.]
MLLVVAAVAVLAVVRSSGGSAGVDQGRPGPVVVVPGYGGR